jgi:hypothetical protein
MLKLSIIVCNCLFILFSTTSFAKGENNVLLEKPYFTIYLETAAAYGLIEFNGYLIFGVEGMPLEVELPVNQWIGEGENELSMLLVPDDEKNKKYDENARVKMSLRVRPSGSDPRNNITLATLEFSGAKANMGKGLEGNTPKGQLNSKDNFSADPKGDILIGDVAIEDYKMKEDKVSRKVTLPKIGLPRWAFLDSDKITNIKSADLDADIDDNMNKQLINEMLPIYAAIWNALQSKSIASIFPLFEERNREYDAAFYREPGTTARLLAESLEEAATSPTKTLCPIKSTNTQSQVYDNDKLARLRVNNHDSLIGFNWEGGGSQDYDIILRKKNGRWIITR